jgi:hypothetical protein
MNCTFNSTNVNITCDIDNEVETDISVLCSPLYYSPFPGYLVNFFQNLILFYGNQKIQEMDIDYSVVRSKLKQHLCCCLDKITEPTRQEVVRRQSSVLKESKLNLRPKIKILLSTIITTIKLISWSMTIWHCYSNLLTKTGTDWPICYPAFITNFMPTLNFLMISYDIGVIRYENKEMRSNFDITVTGFWNKLKVLLMALVLVAYTPFILLCLFCLLIMLYLLIITFMLTMACCVDCISNAVYTNICFGGFLIPLTCVFFDWGIGWGGFFFFLNFIHGDDSNLFAYWNRGSMQTWWYQTWEYNYWNLFI